MAVLTVGLTHHEAPVELRERLAIPRTEYGAAHARLTTYLPDGVILSTCNRTEIYAAVGHRASGHRAAWHFLSAHSGVSEEDLAPYLRTHWQEDAVRHIFRVAAGLDSMIVGEGQIMAQVREAYDLATASGPVGPVLARLFERALVVGKRARTETAIARSAVSVSQAAVELAARALQSLGAASVLLVGAGKMGELAARALKDRGAARLLVANRTATRALDLARRVGGEAWPFDDLETGIFEADVVITSTASEGYILTAERMAALQERRDGRPLVIIDIAVPRDIDPAVGDIPGVELHNVDDLRDVCDANLEQRRREGEKVERIVDEEVGRFLGWCDERELVPTITALVSKAESIRQDELARALPRLGPLSERDQNAINALTRAIVQKMLHEPITRMKRRDAGLNGRHYAHAVQELFALPISETVEE